MKLRSNPYILSLLTLRKLHNAAQHYPATTTASEEVKFQEDSFGRIEIAMRSQLMIQMELSSPSIEFFDWKDTE